MDAASQKLDGLDALRGIAALLVLLHHAFGSVALPQNYDTILLGGIFEEGRLGVNIFFVLSGFVIAWSNPRDGLPARGILIYALRRIARIYPLYWIALLTVLVLNWKMGVTSRGDVTASRLVQDALLLPTGRAPLVWAAWTLVYEMMFYLLFILMLINRRAGLSILTALCVVNIGLFVAGVAPENPWLSHLTALYVLQFFFGVLICQWVQRHPVSPRAARLMVLAGSLALAVIAFVNWSTGTHALPSYMDYAVCAAVIVLGLVSLPPKPDAAQNRVFRILRWLGLYAYSIYLFHIPVQKIVIKAAIKITGTAPGLPVVCGVLLLSIALSLGAGILIGRFIELPMLGHCKKWIAKLKPKKLPLAAAPPAVA